VVDIAGEQRGMDIGDIAEGGVDIRDHLLQPLAPFDGEIVGLRREVGETERAVGGQRNHAGEARAAVSRSEREGDRLRRIDAPGQRERAGEGHGVWSALITADIPAYMDRAWMAIQVGGHVGAVSPVVYGG